MRSLDYISEEESLEYTGKQKVVVGAAASFVFTLTATVMVLLYLELI